MTRLAVFFVLIFVTSAGAQTPSFSEAIEDNSFLIEEAYNQEPGVIQHITNLMRAGRGGDYFLSYTEEWPVTGQMHQLSLTLPYASLATGSVGGPGDALVNYRYQLTGHDDAVTTSPRLSIVLPTGDAAKGLGGGVWGLQVNLPASKRLTENLVAHVNAGCTYLPGAAGSHRPLTYTVGGSGILLLSQRLNLMAEVVAYAADETEVILNPGLRYAIDAGSLQIVPGASVPISFIGGASTANLFFYLSLEHPVSFL